MRSTEWSILFVVMIIVGMILCIIGYEFKEQRLIRECMEDGHKEYECDKLVRRDQKIFLYTN